MDTLYKSFPIFEIKATDGEIEDHPRRVKHIFNVMGISDDSYLKDVIHNGAYKKSIRERLDRVRVLWQHDAEAPPIGVPVSLKEIGKSELPEELLKKYPDATGALYGEVDYLPTPRGEEVLVGLRAGAIKENSIGFDPVEWKMMGDVKAGEPLIRHITQVRLWDISPVNWGANPATMNVKGAVDFTASEKADPEEAFVAPVELSRASAAWVDPDGDPADEKTYRLVHHDAEGRVNWKAVQLAMAELLNGTADIPETERRAVFDHLVKHYGQFGQEPPEFKWIQIAETVRAVRAMSAAELARFSTELRSGSPLAEETVQKLSEMLQSFDLLISEQAEPREQTGETGESVALASAALGNARLEALTIDTRIELAKRRLSAAQRSASL